MVELLHQQTEQSAEALELTNFQNELSDLKQDIGKQQPDDEIQKYEKAKAEYDKARKEYYKQVDALKRREKNKKKLEKEIDECFNIRNKYNEGTKEFAIANKAVDSKCRGIEVRIFGIGGDRLPAPDKITEKDIKNRKIKFNVAIDQKQIEENYVILNNALNIYKSQGLKLDYLRLTSTAWNKNGNDVHSDYESIFKQPIEPKIPKPILPEKKKTQTPEPNLFIQYQKYAPRSVAATEFQNTKSLNTVMGTFYGANLPDNKLTIREFLKLPKNIQDKYIPGAAAWREIIEKVLAK